MRKIITFVMAILTVLATVLQDQFGVTIGLTAALASLTVLLVYIFGEAKNDIARVIKSITQSGKLVDPAFWGAILTGIFPIVNAMFKFELSESTITAIITITIVVLGVIFVKRQKTILD